VNGAPVAGVAGAGLPGYGGGDGPGERGPPNPSAWPEWRRAATRGAGGDASMTREREKDA
jgi:hypothetical protein